MEKLSVFALVLPGAKHFLVKIAHGTGFHGPRKWCLLTFCIEKVYDGVWAGGWTERECLKYIDLAG